MQLPTSACIIISIKKHRWREDQTTEEHTVLSNIYTQVIFAGIFSTTFTAILGVNFQITNLKLSSYSGGEKWCHEAEISSYLAECLVKRLCLCRERITD